MSRISIASLAVLLAVMGGLDAQPAAKADVEAAPATKPAIRRNDGNPVKLAILTVRTNTPVLVQAYVEFRKKHKDDTLVLDLWIQEDWIENPRPLDLSAYDMVFALRCQLPKLDEAIAAAAKRGTWVVSQTADRFPGVASLDDLPDLAPYYRQRGVSNMIGFYEKVCERFEVPGITARPAKEMPTEGIFHPDADRIFPDSASYWKWYASRQGYKADAPRIGIFVYNTLYLNDETDYLAQLVRTVESMGGNPVLGFWFTPSDGRKPAVSPIGRYFDGVDVLVSSAFRLMQEKQIHFKELEKLDVSVLNSIILSVSQDEWQRSPQGIPAGQLLFTTVTPEVAGLIEPTVIAARQKVQSPDSKLDYARTVVIEENYRWQIRRALAWAKLRRTAAAERRVAVLFYNLTGGKHNVGASYLNVTASLDAIVADLGRRGYRTGDAISRETIGTALKALGRSPGRWAPGEVDALVDSGAVLWPQERYLAYFDRLPAEVKRRMTQQWGQPPGDVMTVVREGKRYVVLPAFTFGNILCAPQPARATLDRVGDVTHDPALWPTHQYLAFYLWLRYEWQAHAVVHLGRHGTLEFLPGKANGLSPDDPPGLVLGDLPNINPYIVDGIGEAVAAKRRGQAVIVTHTTPPLGETTLYGAMLTARRKIDDYHAAKQQRQPALVAELQQAILREASGLGYRKGFGPSAPVAGDASQDDVDAIARWLEEIESQRAPRGLHTFGRSYSEDESVRMLRLMFKDELASMSGKSDGDKNAWLSEITKAKTAPPKSEEGPAARVARTAWHLLHNQELDFLAKALDAKYMPAGPPGDPISNPDVLPTGRNQYQINPAKLPTREAWEVGKHMAQATLDLHLKEHGKSLTKIGITLWANTLIRTQGALEAQTLWLMGVEPVWNSRGDVEDVQLMTELGRPRIDVVMTVTGMYRDSFPDKMLLLDKAVLLAAAADDEKSAPNYLRRNTDTIAKELRSRGATEKESDRLAKIRIFGAEPGKYGAGLGRIPATDRWSKRDEMASDYLERMSYSFSKDSWASPSSALFQQQLKGVQAIVHGRSSNLYGVMDLTENFEYQGGMSLAVESTSGKAPELYLGDFTNGTRVSTGREAVVRELLSRYRNPEFIRAMKADGYDGARYLSRIVDHQFGWAVVSDVISADDWKSLADVYLDDRHQLGLREFFESANPHALQSIASRILDVEHQGLRKLDPATLELAARTYVRSVAEHGPSCNSHICAGTALNALAIDVARRSNQIDASTIERFQKRLRQSTDAGKLATAMDALDPKGREVVVSGTVIAAKATAAQKSTSEPAASKSEVESKSERAEASATKSETPGAWQWNPLAWLTGAVCVGAVLGGFLWRRWHDA